MEAATAAHEPKQLGCSRLMFLTPLIHLRVTATVRYKARERGARGARAPAQFSSNTQFDPSDAQPRYTTRAIQPGLDAPRTQPTGGN
jgi:hypothetical protein